MELKQYVVLVSIVVLPKLLFCLRTPIRTRIFKVVHKHPKIKSCAQKILQKDEYTGGRVHKLTGDCEGLNSSVSNKKTYDKGYAYFEQLLFREEFFPPVAALNPIDISDFTYGLMRGKVLTLVATFVGLNRIVFAGNISEKGIHYGISEHFFVGYANDGVELQHGKVCLVGNLILEEKARFTFKFRTNDSMELIINDTNICRFWIPKGFLDNFKQVYVSNPVQSISYG